MTFISIWSRFKVEFLAGGCAWNQEFTHRKNCWLEFGFALTTEPRKDNNDKGGTARNKASNMILGLSFKVKETGIGNKPSS